MLKIAVCDDEEYYLSKIIKQLEAILQEQGISAFKIDDYTSGTVFLQNYDKLIEYNVVFLDINMQNINGMKIAKQIRDYKLDTLLVFITAFIDYAVEGYRMEAIRFLLKDMLEDTLPECVETVINKLSLQVKKIKFNFIEGERELSVDSILFIESNVHKLFFYTIGEKQFSFSLYGKLDKIADEFTPFKFLRIHKSFLVNTKYIENIKNYKVIMSNGRVLPVPREKYQKVKERYYEIKGDLV